MARRIPSRRFQDLVDAATAVFIAHGYRRTQMADVAAAMGVAKGTLYLCVESKEALFEVALRYSDAPRPITAPPTLPVPAPAPGQSLRHVRDRLTGEPASPTLSNALSHARVEADADGLVKIVRELYQTMARNRTGIKLVDRCASEYPQLAKVWFSEGRGMLLTQLTRYLDVGIRQGQLRTVADTAVAARLIIETLVFWAVHRHWDPSPQPVDARLAEETVVQMLGSTLIEPERERR